MELPSINVLGCGWFGFSLAKFLAGQGYPVKGSATSQEKLEHLYQTAIDGFLVSFGPEPMGSIPDFFQHCDTIVLTVPPGRDPEIYPQKVAEIVKCLKRYKIRRVIFISSTSVYNECNADVSESSPASPETNSAKALVKAEKLLLAENEFNTIIIRFAGLIGPGRHPASFFAGRKDIPNGRAPVNLVHLDDCVQAVFQLIRQNISEGIYNLCSPDHPQKQVFYSKAAKAKGLETPRFRDELISWKKVNGTKIMKAINGSYSISDLSDWLKNS